MSLVTDNLQVHYDFSNTSCYPGTGTTVTNLGLAGSTYNGTVSAASFRTGTPNGTIPTFVNDNGGVFRFYGDKGRIIIPHGAAVTGIATNSVTRTFQLWIKFDTLSSTDNPNLNAFLGKLTNLNGFDGYVGFALNTGSMRLVLNDDSETTHTTTTGLLVPNQWYLLTYAINTERVDNRVQFFINDTEVTISPTRYSATNWNTGETNPLLLGTGFLNYSNGLCESFQGQIGAFYLYTDRLTPAEVAANYNATKARYEGATAVRYWDGDSWETSSAQKVYNGTNWIDWDAKRWNGTNWIDI